MSDRIADAERLLATLVRARAQVRDLQGGRGGGPIDDPLTATPTPKPSRKADVDPIQASTSDVPADPSMTAETTEDTASPEESPVETVATEAAAVEETQSEAIPSETSEPSTTSDDPFDFLDQAPPDEEPVPALVDEQAPSADPSPSPAEEPQGTDAAISREPPPRRPAPLPAHPILALGAPPLIRAPRAVQPRLRDPDAPHLDVDYLPPDPILASSDIQQEVDVPQLTDNTASPSRREPINAPIDPHPELAFDGRMLAGQALQRGDLHEAIMHYSDVLDFEPADTQVRLSRGRCHRDLGDHSAAMSDFFRAQDHAPFSPEPWVEMGDLSFARKDYSRAISLYSQAIGISPEHAMAYCRRGICHHYRLRPENAVEDLRYAQQLDPMIPNIDRYVQMASKPRR